MSSVGETNNFDKTVVLLIQLQETEDFNLRRNKGGFFQFYFKDEKLVGIKVQYSLLGDGIPFIFDQTFYNFPIDLMEPITLKNTDCNSFLIDDILLDTVFNAEIGEDIISDFGSIIVDFNFSFPVLTQFNVVDPKDLRIKPVNINLSISNQNIPLTKPDQVVGIVNLGLLDENENINIEFESEKDKLDAFSATTNEGGTKITDIVELKTASSERNKEESSNLIGSGVEEKLINDNELENSDSYNNLEPEEKKDIMVGFSALNILG